MINGKTLAAGETAALKLEGHDVTVHCVAVNESSASVTIDGVNGLVTLTLR